MVSAPRCGADRQRYGLNGMPPGLALLRLSMNLFTRRNRVVLMGQSLSIDYKSAPIVVDRIQSETIANPVTNSVPWVDGA